MGLVIPRRTILRSALKHPISYAEFGQGHDLPTSLPSWCRRISMGF
jgi:hypothetical protein